MFKLGYEENMNILFLFILSESAPLKRITIVQTELS